MQGAGQRAGEAPRKGGWVELLAGFGDPKRAKRCGEKGMGGASSWLKEQPYFTVEGGDASQ